ncbi:hypothetical protein HPC72_02910 [Actinomyces marmotae]|uniref:Transposase IS204/IS1001/IS1096/IS1165 DDE domain-containing protein n=1 Tax=Actinomyces marmotae TaxID=2737173 RepID=A0A6M8AYT6_9ACTO|nr:hypothetical protein HPC72_02910 [Actinomyces marmotae]
MCGATRARATSASPRSSTRPQCARAPESGTLISASAPGTAPCAREHRGRPTSPTWSHGRSKQALTTWTSPQAWPEGIEAIAMEGFTGLKTSTTQQMADAAPVLGPFHVARQAGHAPTSAASASSTAAWPRLPAQRPLRKARPIPRPDTDLITPSPRSKRIDTPATSLNQKSRLSAGRASGASSRAPPGPAPRAITSRTRRREACRWEESRQLDRSRS